MPDIPIDAGILIGISLTAVIMTLLTTMFILHKVLKSPEFRMRMKRKKWVYALLKNRLGELKDHLIPLDSINGTDNSFKIGKGIYFWRAQDKFGRQTAFPYRRKLGAIYRFGHSWPEAFAAQSMSSTGYTAEDMERIIESRVEENIIEAMRKKTGPLVLLALISLASLGGVIYVAATAYHPPTVAGQNSGTGSTSTTTVLTCPAGKHIIADYGNGTVICGVGVT
jgi:hypothetical protein